MNHAREQMASPSSLLAIAWAAYRSGDKELLRSTRELLKTDFGIEIRFARKQSEAPNA